MLIIQKRKQRFKVDKKLNQSPTAIRSSRAGSPSQPVWRLGPFHPIGQGMGGYWPESTGKLKTKTKQPQTWPRARYFRFICLLKPHRHPCQAGISAPVLQISSREGSEHLPQISVTHPSRDTEAHVGFCFFICTVQGHTFKLECFYIYVNVCSHSLAQENIRVTTHIHSIIQ